MPGIVQCVLQVLIDSILTATLDEVGTIISPFSQLRHRSGEAACLKEHLLLGKAWEGWCFYLRFEGVYRDWHQVSLTKA